jgi:enoyl-CoA hydratase
MGGELVALAGIIACVFIGGGRARSKPSSAVYSPKPNLDLERGNAVDHRGERQVEVRLDERPHGLIAFVFIDNARRLNVMNSALMAQFVEELSKLAREERLRALVLTGAGERAFIGGADIKEMGAIDDSHGARTFISRVHACCDAIRSIPVPTIARIHGFAFGAGLEIAAACDLRIASETATFGMPEVKLGIPSVVEAALLPMLVGWGRARQILLLGETFSAQDALSWGLLERVTPPEHLDEAVEDWLGQVLSSKPRAVRLQKKLIRSWEDSPLRAAIQAGIDSFAAAFETDEPTIAMRDFFAAQAERKAAAFKA